MYKRHIWTDEQIKIFWNYESRFPENYWSRNFGKDLIKKYSRYLKDAKIILDLGCGDGGLIESILQVAKNNFKNSAIYGVDTSDTSIKKINKTFTNHPLFSKAVLASNEIEMKKIYNKVDFIFCCEVIEHLYDKNLSKLLKSAKDLISDKGLILFTTPNNEDLTKGLICNPIDGSLFHRWQHVRTWNRDNLTKKLNQFGFKVIDINETNTWWWAKFPKNLLNRWRYRDKGSLFILATKQNNIGY